MSLRTAPRRRFEYQTLLVGPERTRFDLSVAAAGSDPWWLPLWHDCVVLPSGLASGSDEITFATAFREFKAGGKALLRNGAAYEVVDVDTVVSNKITLTDPTVETWPANTTLYPLRYARLENEPSADRLADRTWTAMLAFTCLEVDDWSLSLSVLASYRSYPVLERAPNERDGLSISLTRIAQDIDTTIGLPAFYNTAGAGLRVQQHAWMLRGLSDNAVFRSFLYGVRGRAKALWLPSFQADLDLTEAIDAADTTIKVVECGYAAASAHAVDNKRDIRIALKDGTSVLRRVTASSEAGGVETLTLNSAVGQDIALADVHRVEFLSLCRLDADSIEIAHLTDTAGVSAVSATFRSHLSGRAVSPWDPLPWANPDEEDDNTPPDPIGTADVLARIFTSTAFETQYDGLQFPLSVDSVDYDTPVDGVTFATGAQLGYREGGPTNSVLFLELIATDDVLDPLPADEQPTTWTVEAIHAGIKLSVDKTTFGLYSPAYSPIYSGVRLEWFDGFTGADTIVCRGRRPDGVLCVLTFTYEAQAEAPATLDVYNPTNTTISGGGLTATSLLDAVGARTSKGRSTGKYYFRGIVDTATRPDDSAVNFGLIAGSADIAGPRGFPGGVGDTSNTALGIGPYAHFIFTNAVYRFYNNSAPRYSIDGGQIVDLLFDLDNQLWWFRFNANAGGDTGWLYEGLGGSPEPDPSLAVGGDFSSYLTLGETLYPFVFFEYDGYSGTMDFSPDLGAYPAPGALPWGAL